MLLVISRCLRANVSRPGLIFASQYVHTRLMCAGLMSFCLYLPMSLGRFVHSKIDVSWSICSDNGWCCPTNVHPKWLMYTRLGWYFMQLGNVACQMDTCLIRTCKLWLKSQANGLCLIPDTLIVHLCMKDFAYVLSHWQCCLPYAHMLEKMHARLCWFCQLLDYIFILICVVYA